MLTDGKNGEDGCCAGTGAPAAGTGIEILVEADSHLLKLGTAVAGRTESLSREASVGGRELGFERVGIKFHLLCRCFQVVGNCN